MGGVKENNMTERLTIKNSDGTYSQPTDTTFEMVFNKLGRLEDILEKYDLEVEELDERIYNGAFNYIDKLKAETDRDTWKKACEFACDVLRDINYKIYNEDRIDFENTFYQQAKKEGNDEN